MVDGSGIILEVCALRVIAGSAPILDEVTFDVRRGEILAVSGPSGAGKTTIAAALAGVTGPGTTLAGTIAPVGGPIRIGYLPQDAAATLNPARRIGAALAELAVLECRRRTGRHPSRAHRRALVSRALAAAAFASHGPALGRIAASYPFEFSGGERTRLALAQVMVGTPDVLVVDEPTVGLDPLARSTLLTRLAALRDQGTSIVLVTHDPVAVERLADRTLFVRGGRLVQTPAPAPAPSRSARPSSAGPGGPALRLRGVTITRGTSTVLDGADLEIGSGEMLGLVGVSGAGKSTIGRCVAGLVAADAGAVMLDGVPMPVLRRRSRSQVAAVQYVWQESAASFDPRRTVLHQVAATGVRLRGLDRAAAHREAVAALDELGIDAEQARRYPPGLSGGQLQRAALARALLARPRVLVCDEVTTALDRPLAGRILDRVDEYRRTTGAAVLWISHDLRAQFDRVDRLVLLDAGRIAETGVPAELRARPATLLLRRLLAAEDLLDVGGDCRAVGGDGCDPRSEPTAGD